MSVAKIIIIVVKVIIVVIIKIIVAAARPANLNNVWSCGVYGDNVFDYCRCWLN